MMLRRGWFARRRAAAQSVVVLDFYAVCLEAMCEHGTYYVERVGGDWSARFRPKDARWEARDVTIDAVDGDGSSVDWPSRGRAVDACQLHAHLLELGHSVGRATQLVAERAQRISQHQRVDTVDYAEPVAAGART